MSSVTHISMCLRSPPPAGLAALRRHTTTSGRQESRTVHFPGTFRRGKHASLQTETHARHLCRTQWLISSQGQTWPGIPMRLSVIGATLASLCSLFLELALEPQMTSKTCPLPVRAHLTCETIGTGPITLLHVSVSIGGLDPIC